ncbi:MAG: ATP-binding protein [Erysipelotrichaceae bacterium]|nr:ATP-binding protein [Erysipelotrichaceae bacterium]
MTKTEMIREDAYLSRFAEDESFVQEHLGTFLRVLSSRKKCEGCQGLAQCSQPSVGERLCLSNDGVLIEEIEYCEFALKARSSQSVLDRYMYCDVAKNLADLDLNNVRYAPEQKQLYLALAAILYEKSDRGLYICGDLGVGKTYLCTALANSLVKKGKKVAFVKVSNFFNEMKSYFGTASEMIDRNISILKNAGYLFLDDIGSETVSEFVRDDILFRILDHRMENSLITMFTSNLNKEELLKHYQYDRKEKSNLMNARRLLERIDILSDNFVLSGQNMRRG